MDRSHEPRRGAMAAATNGMSRRRQRSSSLRDFPEDEGVIELQESMRFRERVGKKDRDRDRERDRDRDRASRSKRRRVERLLQGNNREDAGEESMEDSVDDEDDEEDEDALTMALRLQQVNPPVGSASSTVPDHKPRKSFPAKSVRPLGSWKVAEEIIGASVPRKARSASAKRSQECLVSGGGSNGTESIQRQASTSPARTNTVAAAPAATSSPSSPNARRKMKPTGSKHRPPKVSKASSIQETEIEFEIAEVLYGMTRQLHCPLKQEATASASQKLNIRDANGSSNDAKSSGSSPISILPPTEPSSSALMQSNSISMVVAPKRKRPRPFAIVLEEEKPVNSVVPESSVSPVAKIEAQKEEKIEIAAHNLEKMASCSVEDNRGMDEMGISLIPSIPVDLPPETVKTEGDPDSDSTPPKACLNVLDEVEAKEEINSPDEGSTCRRIHADPEDEESVKQEPGTSTHEITREKIDIDLMATPSGKSSPERDDNVASGQKSFVMENGTLPKEEVMVEGKKDNLEVAVEVGPKMKTETIEDLDTQNRMDCEKNLELQFDAKKLDEDDEEAQVQSLAAKGTKNEIRAEETGKISADLSAQSSSSSLQRTVSGWSGGLPSIGLMGQIPPHPPVSMDVASGSATAMQPPSFLFPRPRPKRCATHVFIAQTINYHRQVARISNSFWPGLTGFAAPCGTKPCNLGVFPNPELAILGSSMQSSFAGGNLSSVQGKGSGAEQASNDVKNSVMLSMDSSQRKPLMQAPFLLSLNQPHPTPSASGSVKSATATGNASSSSSASNTLLNCGSAPAAAVTFNPANLPPNEATRYLAMLQSNSYPFPVPAQVGGPPLYRGGHHPPVPVPFFNGSFYSHQILHPSQLQLPHIPSQNSSASTTSVSSTSQMHHLQQQQPQGCHANGSGGVSSGFPSMNQHFLPSQHSRQLECEIGSGDKSSNSDARVSNPQKGVLSHNFPMPIHPQNFTIMSPCGGNGGDKQQQQSMKGGLELNQSQAFAMSFAAFNNSSASPGLEFSSMAPNHLILQSLPEAARHMHAAASALSSRLAQQKNHQSIEEKKPSSDSSNLNPSAEEERKMKMAGKAAASNYSHTLSFSRADNDNHSIASILGNSAVDSPSKISNSLPPAAVNGIRSPSLVGVSSMPLLSQQKMMQLQKQQLPVQSKSVANNVNPNLYPDRSSSVGKFPNAVFPQTLVQGGVPTQLPQWKTPPTKAGPMPIPSSEGKPLAQLQGSSRVHLGAPGSSGHSQITFGASAKSLPSIQQFTCNNASPSSLGGLPGSPSPPLSKSGTGGSPIATADSKSCPNPMTSSSQTAKNRPSSSSSSRKSSPVNSRHLPSVIGNSNLGSAQTSGMKHQQQQPQLSKQPMLQHASQPIFSTFYMQAQSPQSTSTSTSGSYQKWQFDQHQHPPNSLAMSSTAMIPLSVPFSSGSTSDSVKAVAAATNMKGLPPHGFLQAAQLAAQSAANPHLLMSAAIPYIHSGPVPVKSSEQKPAAGNDILHPSWQPEKR